MKKYLVAAACLTLVSGAVYARKLNKEQKRLEECGVVMQEVLNVPDNIPHELLEKAECVIVIPSVEKLAFGVGADYGRGAMICRTGEHFRGAWARPQCTRSKAAALVSKSAEKPLTWFCWS